MSKWSSRPWLAYSPAPWWDAPTRTSGQSVEKLHGASAEPVSGPEIVAGCRVTSEQRQGWQTTSGDATGVLKISQHFSTGQDGHGMANDSSFEDGTLSRATQLRRGRRISMGYEIDNPMSRWSLHSMTPSPLFSRRRSSGLSSRIPVARHSARATIRTWEPLAAALGDIDPRTDGHSGPSGDEGEDGQYELAQLKSQLARACQQIDRLEWHFAQRPASRLAHPTFATHRTDSEQTSMDNADRPAVRPPSRKDYRSGLGEPDLAGCALSSEVEEIEGFHPPYQGHACAPQHHRRSAFIEHLQHYRNASGCTAASVSSEETAARESVAAPDRLPSYAIFSPRRSSVIRTTFARSSAVLGHAFQVPSRKVRVALVDTNAAVNRGERHNVVSPPSLRGEIDITPAASAPWSERADGSGWPDYEQQSPLDRYLTSRTDVSFTSFSETCTSLEGSREGVQPLPSASDYPVPAPAIHPRPAGEQKFVFRQSGQHFPPPRAGEDPVDVKRYGDHSSHAPPQLVPQTIRRISSSNETSTNSLPTPREVSFPTYPTFESSINPQAPPVPRQLTTSPTFLHEPEEYWNPPASHSKPSLLASIQFSTRPRRKLKALLSRVVPRRGMKAEEIAPATERFFSPANIVQHGGQKKHAQTTTIERSVTPPRSSGMDSTLQFEQSILKQIGRPPSRMFSSRWLDGRPSSKRSSVASIASATVRTAKAGYHESDTQAVCHDLGPLSLSPVFATPVNASPAPVSPTRRPRAAMSSRSPTKHGRRRYQSRHRKDSVALSYFSFGSGPSLSFP
ncbi:hypothetical protein LTR37_017281 [Vermiconidia calcicola]|uniref:Uncharacterized protein n=1 Tax=Vermiconidia calcicola TaxID=1690605 RepID=A0ACC3MKH7_9PEZI|nr:hypothetical protein LTR37_017281 [Vermiconidia calcicola]